MDRRKFLRLSQKGLLTSAILSGFPHLVKANSYHESEIRTKYISTYIPSNSYFKDMKVTMSLLESDITNFKSTSVSSIKSVILTSEAYSSLGNKVFNEIEYSIKSVEPKDNDIYLFQLKFVKILNKGAQVLDFLINDLEDLTYDKPLNKISIYSNKGDLEVALTKEVNNSDTEDWDCYLTTACVSEMGLPDNCNELSKLRFLRDNYILKTAEGQEMIKEYYRKAPLVVKSLNKLKNRSGIYRHIYHDLISFSVRMIENGNYEEATEYYKSYMQALMLKVLN